MVRSNFAMASLSPRLQQSPYNKADKKMIRHLSALAPTDDGSMDFNDRGRQGLSGNTRSDRTAHAGAAETAIAHRILRQVLLVIVLGEIERRRVDDLGGDRTKAAALELLLVHRLRRLGGFALGVVIDIDAGAILRTNVVTLAHALGRIVAFPERLEQLVV